MGEPGRLVVCATPIGNLGDVTLRVLDALREADTVAAEDTRVTRKLLARYEIDTRLERCDEHTVERQTPALVERMLGGEVIALVSDAGTPGVSDPGARLVDACIDADVQVEVLPGASAILAALVASGLPTHAFYFGGFLPRKAGERRRALDALGGSRRDARSSTSRRTARRRRLRRSPRRCPDAGRPSRANSRSCTRRSSAAPSKTSLPTSRARESLKGEVVLLVGPPPARVREQVDPVLTRAQVDELIAEGVSRSEAVKRVAKDLGIPRSEVYEIAHRATE